MADRSKSGGVLLPISRVRTIMKSSPEVSNISQESLFLITRATELFVQDLAQQTLKKNTSGNSVEYTDLARLVDRVDQLQFLADIVPRKIKVKDYYAMLEKKKRKSSGSAGKEEEEPEEQS